MVETRVISKFSATATILISILFAPAIATDSVLEDLDAESSVHKSRFGGPLNRELNRQIKGYDA